MNKFSKKQAKKTIKKGAKRISEEDLKKVIEKENFIEEKIIKNKTLKSLYEDVKLFISIIKDYYKGNYKDIPYWSIAAIGFSLLYFLSPIDFVPDFIPMVGYVDDALILATCYKMIKKDLMKYKEWKVLTKSPL